MPVTITRRYTFSASHQLHGLPPGHKCARLHGHNYEVDLEVGVAPGCELDNGFVLDAGVLDGIVGPIILSLDHRHLNDLSNIEGIDNEGHPLHAIKVQPTAENIALCLLKRCELVSNSGKWTLLSVTVGENGRLWARATP